VVAVKRHFRHSDRVLRDRRWPALRQAALRRDDYRCRSCGARGRLEVDHVRPVRDAPELAFELDNLQSLCGPCHSRKTRGEVGLPQLDPERARWRKAVAALAKSKS
jgi:5-methylcytosine-specific restriction endonuclease McrA